MKTRIVSAMVYVAILFVFYVLKVVSHDFWFDLVIYAFALIGTFEMLRATSKKTTKSERILVMTFTALCIPACAICEEYFRYGLHVVSACFIGLAVLLLLLLVVESEQTSLESVGVSFLSAVYPTFLLCLMVLSNHMIDAPQLDEYKFNTNLLILFIFIIPSCSDVFAYFTGFLLHKKFPKKMAPIISPKKTVVGGIGGLFGGVFSAAVLYFVYGAIFGSFDMMFVWLPVYMLIGFLIAVATMFGDLVESSIKRKVGIKDMGNIMPGHGGVLDRIDSILLSTVVVYLVFVVVYLITGVFA